ncbi:hypothetical protein BDP27DRAFT_1429903 [Rhodocollybia butyracea]|uniref:Uncharacterized protein n=1 Tax=Rhodocollybia butyracea TaxID=206335 RepID=A0A9P5PBU0_9AGAR|nr:hypothetical protein BDP27DRAFT_1429903 [Rhodocollybia butyracea]
MAVTAAIPASIIDAHRNPAAHRTNVPWSADFANTAGYGSEACGNDVEKVSMKKQVLARRTGEEEERCLGRASAPTSGHLHDQRILWTFLSALPSTFFDYSSFRKLEPTLEDMDGKVATPLGKSEERALEKLERGRSAFPACGTCNCYSNLPLTCGQSDSATLGGLDIVTCGQSCLCSTANFSFCRDTLPSDNFEISILTSLVYIGIYETTVSSPTNSFTSMDVPLYASLDRASAIHTASASSATGFGAGAKIMDGL